MTVWSVKFGVVVDNRMRMRTFNGARCDEICFMLVKWQNYVTWCNYFNIWTGPSYFHFHSNVTGKVIRTACPKPKRRKCHQWLDVCDFIVIYLCSVQCIHDSAEEWVVIIFMFLADELDVSQLSEVEVSLLLQSLYSQLHIQQLWAKTVIKTSNALTVLKKQGEGKKWQV